MHLVLKLGGELLAEHKRDEANAIAADIATLVDRGDRVILIHGGGPQTTALQRALGQSPNIVGGRRITDADALEAIKMAVGGKLNIDFCSLLQRHGVDAVGLNGASSRLIAANKRPPRVVSGCGDEPVDFGHVGDVSGVNHGLLELLLSGGYVPVLACIGGGADGEVYNINADIVATDVAASVKADRLLLVTSTPGVLRDLDDFDTRICTMTVSEGRAAIADGTIAGGMIPKLEESFKAIGLGVRQIQIVGQLGKGDVIRCVDEPGAVGTTLTAD